MKKNLKNRIFFNSFIIAILVISFMPPIYFDKDTEAIVNITDKADKVYYNKLDTDLYKHMMATETLIVGKQEPIQTIMSVTYEKTEKGVRFVLPKKEVEQLKMERFFYEDDYLKGFFTIDMQEDYSAFYKDETFPIDDEVLEYIQICTQNENTRIIFAEKEIYAYIINEDSNCMYVDILKPKEAYEKVVVVDPGHGDIDSGTYRNTTYEKNINFDVAMRVCNLFKDDKKIKVYSTKLEDVKPSLKERAYFANRLEADLFVSIHCNSTENSNVAGTQVYYPDPVTKRGTSSKNYADILLNNVSDALGVGKASTYQPWGYDFVVLKETEVPACLIEMAYFTNDRDFSILNSEEGRKKASVGIYEGIKECLLSSESK